MLQDLNNTNTTPQRIKGITVDSTVIESSLTCILNDIDKKRKKFWEYIKAKRFSNSLVKCLTKNDQTFTKTNNILNTLKHEIL